MIIKFYRNTHTESGEFRPELDRGHPYVRCNIHLLDSTTGLTLEEVIQAHWTYAQQEGRDWECETPEEILQGLAVLVRDTLVRMEIVY